jgi:formiminoglutamase
MERPMTMQTEQPLVARGTAPLIVSIPHAGARIPEEIEATLESQWLGRKDADWWVDRLYDFAPQLGATVIATPISRTVIDVNRDPSGKSLYPGQATTELCPTVTFDGEPLYQRGHEPDMTAIVSRRVRYFDPYHRAIGDELARLEMGHRNVVLFEAHSIRSKIPRLFEDELPNFNIGTNSGASCDARLQNAVEDVCDASRFSHVVNGRFKGGWTTRHYGHPELGVHAIQLELACRGYMDEPTKVKLANWPPPFDPVRAAPMREVLKRILDACIRFAETVNADQPQVAR